jgi:hypothetical protein
MMLDIRKRWGTTLTPISGIASKTDYNESVEMSLKVKAFRYVRSDLRFKS